MIIGAVSIGSAAARRLASKDLVVHSVKLGPRTISVGNLQAGGAGKTPLVAKVAAEALSRGVEPCILSRGYGGQWESEGGVLSPGEKKPDPRFCGDEPALLRELVPMAWIGVGSDRVSSYEKAVAKRGKPFELVILDDGFQHHKIRKDLEIVALTSDSPRERVYRDFPSELKYAGLVIWTKGEKSPLATVPQSVPQIKAKYVPRLLFGPKAPLGELCLVTGVGDGLRVRKSIEEAGFRVAMHLERRDHVSYDRADAEALISKAKDANLTLAMTGKDWVKFRLALPEAENVAVFEPEVIFEKGGELWSEILWR